MKIMVRMVFFGVLCAVVCTSCLSLLPKAEYTAPTVYDIALPQPIPDLPFTINIQSFAGTAGRYKMVFRENANKIQIDEYNRWASPPSYMLTKFLSARFASNSSGKKIGSRPVLLLDLIIQACELNRETKTVDLLVNYTVTNLKTEDTLLSGSVDYRIPVKNCSPDDFADGLREAALQFSNHLVESIKQELKRVAQEKDSSIKTAPAQAAPVP